METMLQDRIQDNMGNLVDWTNMDRTFSSLNSHRNHDIRSESRWNILVGHPCLNGPSPRFLILVIALRQAVIFWGRIRKKNVRIRSAALVDGGELQAYFSSNVCRCNGRGWRDTAVRLVFCLT